METGEQNRMAQTEARFGMFPWIFGGAVSPGDMAHGFSGFCKNVVVFGSAFFGAGFGQVLPAIQHRKNHAYYIPRNMVKMFFSAD